MPVFDQHEYQSVILGALLHDIGKFWQRAELPCDYLSNEGLKQICCPFNKSGGYFTHQHVLYSGNFVKQCLPMGFDAVENLVLFHHLHENYTGDKKLAKIVTLADWLSSGERRGKEGEEPSDPKREPLVSVFTRIKLDGKSVDERYIPLFPLDSDLTNVFPVVSKDQAISHDPQSENSFSRMWEKFTTEAGFLKDADDFDVFYTRLLHLLEKYILFIPASAYRDKPDLSLYHHLRSTAALAACIYQLNLTESELDHILNAIRGFPEKRDTVLNDGSLLLVAGDISGIQDFIYSVTSEHALKGLRGRSLYVQLLSETVAKVILKKFNLPLSNLLYSGGGHFYLITPIKSNALNKIEETRHKIDKIMLEGHRGRLSIALASHSLCWGDFLTGNFSEKWVEVGRKLVREKKRKFYMLFENPADLEHVLGPYEKGGEQKACEICGDELPPHTEGQCQTCESFAKLASDLSRARVLEEEEVPIQGGSRFELRSLHDVFGGVGYRYQFAPSTQNKKIASVLNTTAFIDQTDKYLGFRFIASHTPIKDGRIKTLEELSGESEGIQKWGVFRADVDHLGRIFSEGLGEDRTISRVTMLSYLISLFFTTQIETIVKKPGFADKVYVIYSGGDDLFIIGAWSVLPELAQRIYKEFRLFTGENPNLTLSGGIYLAPSKKFPVYQAAEEAGKALEKAKAEGRNRLTFFDQAIPWEKLGDIVVVKDKIVSLIDGGEGTKKVSRSLLSILYSSWEDKKLAEKKGISMFRIWQLLYALKRLKERHSSRADELDALEKKMIIDHNLRPYLDISVRWAEYLTRKEER